MTSAAIRPPFDPELEPALGALAELGIPASLTAEGIGALRELTLSVETIAPPLPVLRERADVEQHTVPGPSGQPDISLLVLRPKGAPITTLLPGVYHTHGGGMIAGDQRVSLPILLGWMDEIPMVIVSVEYRLAPEHPHPAPSEDCFAGLLWTAEHLQQLGIDADQLIVAGASAGGGLAAAMALMARDRGGPRLAGQMLMCPMLDDRALTPSSTMLVGEGIWDSVSNHTGWTALLGESAGGADVSPYAAPARAVDLSGLPPAYIDVGTVETFRDEDIAYAQAIWQTGGDAELHVWAGGFHSFDMVPTTKITDAAVAARMSWLHRRLDS